MSDRTSAGLFATMFAFLAERPDARARAMAVRLWGQRGDYDFDDYQLGCDEALEALGLAERGDDGRWSYLGHPGFIGPVTLDVGDALGIATPSRSEGIAATGHRIQVFLQATRGEQAVQPEVPIPELRLDLFANLELCRDGSRRLLVLRLDGAENLALDADAAPAEGA